MSDQLDNDLQRSAGGAEAPAPAPGSPPFTGEPGPAGGDPTLLLEQLLEAERFEGRETRRAIHAEAAGLRESIGWCLIVLAGWLFFLGVLMAKQQIRGSL